MLISLPLEGFWVPLSPIITPRISQSGPLTTSQTFYTMLLLSYYPNTSVCLIPLPSHHYSRRVSENMYLVCDLCLSQSYPSFRVRSIGLLLWLSSKKNPRVRSLVWENATYHGETKPMHHIEPVL